MQNGLLFANAAVKTMESKLFGAEKMARLQESDNLTDAVRILREAGYDYSNADMERLEEDGTKKLEEYQSQGSVEVYLPTGVELRVGDMVFAADRSSGIGLQAMVAKKIVRGSSGVVTVEYECGNSETGSSGGIYGSAETPTIVPLSAVVGIATLMAET